MISGGRKRVADLTFEQFGERLDGPGLGLQLGPFAVHLTVRVPHLLRSLYLLYAFYPLLESERVYSMRAELRAITRLRPRPRRLVRFTVDGRVLHEDLPLEQGLAVLEWGINLVVALRFHCFLTLHTAVLERNGGALLLPAAPGHGKTTLCVALAHRGWRLFSDEFGLVRPGTTALVPLPRPMPLKNQSIAIIRTYAPEAMMGPEIPGTRKGTIAHVRPPEASIDQVHDAAEAAWLVFPRWQSGAKLSLAELPAPEGFMRLATNAFNYDRLGENGFTTVRDLVSQTRSYRLVYSDLDEAIGVLNHLADAGRG